MHNHKMMQAEEPLETHFSTTLEGAAEEILLSKQGQQNKTTWGRVKPQENNRKRRKGGVKQYFYKGPVGVKIEGKVCFRKGGGEVGGFYRATISTHDDASVFKHCSFRVYFSPWIFKAIYFFPPFFLAEKNIQEVRLRRWKTHL